MRKLIWIFFSIGIVGSYLPNNRPFGINLTYGDIAYSVCFILILLSKTQKNKNRKGNINFNIIVFGGVFFLALGSLLSFMRSTNVIESFATLVQYIFVFTILLYVIKYLLETEMKKSLLKIILITILPHLIIDILNLLSYLNILNTLDAILISGNGRYVGFYGNANALGLNTISTYIFLILFLIYSDKKLNKIIVLFFIISTLISLALSASFGSIILIFLVSLIILWYMSSKKKLKFFSFLSGALIVVFAISISFTNPTKFYSAFIPEKLVDRITNAESDGLGSSSLRIDLNREGIEKFIESPIVGLGFTEFPKISMYNQTVHNTIIVTAAETGVFGLLGIFILIIYPIFLSFRMFKKTEGELKVILLFLYIYSIFRLLSTLTSGHFISREPWIPILCIFVIYTIRLRKAILIKN